MIDALICGLLGAALAAAVQQIRVRRLHDMLAEADARVAAEYRRATADIIAKRLAARKAERPKRRAAGKQAAINHHRRVRADARAQFEEGASL